MTRNEAYDSADKLPLLAANPFRQLALTGQQPPSPYSNQAIITTYVLGAYATTGFLGPNWFRSHDHTITMRVIHTTAAMIVNTVLTSDFSLGALQDIFQDSKALMNGLKRCHIRSSMQSIGWLASKLGLAYIGATPYADMSNELPWFNELVRQSYFIAYIPMFYSGNGIFIRSIGQVMQKEYSRLLHCLPNSAVRQYRQCYESKHEQQLIVAAVSELLEAAIRHAKRDHIILDANSSSHEAILNLLSSETLIPSTTNWAAYQTTLAGLLTAIVIYSYSGFFNEMTSESNTLFDKVTSAISIVSLTGLSIISSQKLAVKLTSLCRNIIANVPLITGISGPKKALALTAASLTGVMTYGMAFLTSTAAIDTLDGTKPFISRPYLEFIRIMSYLGVLSFNGTPLTSLTLGKLSKRLSRPYENDKHLLTYDIEHILGHLKHNNLEAAYKLCQAIHAERNLGDNRIMKTYLSKQLNRPINNDMINSLMSSDNPTALYPSLPIASAARARREVASYYFLRTTLPAIATWMIQPLLQSLSLFDDTTGNDFTLYLVSYLTFTILTLINMRIIRLPEQPSPDTMLGRLAIAGATLTPALFGATVQLAMGNTLEAITGIHEENIINDISFSAGAIAASTAALSLA